MYVVRKVPYLFASSRMLTGGTFQLRQLVLSFAYRIQIILRKFTSSDSQSIFGLYSWDDGGHSLSGQSRNTNLYNYSYLAILFDVLKENNQNLPVKWPKGQEKNGLLVFLSLLFLSPQCQKTKYSYTNCLMNNIH